MSSPRPSLGDAMATAYTATAAPVVAPIAEPPAARSASQSSLARAFGELSLEEGPIFTIPFVPEVYLQGPFASSQQRRSSLSNPTSENVETPSRPSNIPSPGAAAAEEPQTTKYTDVKSSMASGSAQETEGGHERVNIYLIVSLTPQRWSSYRHLCRVAFTTPPSNSGCPQPGVVRRSPCHSVSDVVITSCPTIYRLPRPLEQAIRSFRQARRTSPLGHCQCQYSMGTLAALFEQANCSFRQARRTRPLRHCWCQYR
ncbi:hypothetical protein AC1031_019019 [Aphanomyces cochlioides]|nr:hypothetical protein AC1031_019019 [Aphanomyces cochlioides]